MRSTAVLILALAALGGLAYLFFMGESEATPDLAGTGERTEIQEPTRPAAELNSSPAREVIQPDTVAREEIPLLEELSPEQYASGVVGRVVNELGEPVEGAQMVLAFADEMFRDQPGLGGADKPDRKVETDKDGRYLFDHLEPADYYTVFATHPEFGSGRLTAVRVPFQTYEEQPDLQLSMGSSLSGNVTDPAGNPILDAKITLGSDLFNRRASRRDMKTGKTDDVGHFAIPDIPGGTFGFLVEAEGFATHYMTGLPFDGKKPRTRDVQLEFAEGIAGVVVDQRGTPVKGATVTGIRYKSSKLVSRDTWTTDSSGEFELAHLEAGDYTILVEADGYAPGRENVVPTGTSTVTIELKRRATISGEVVSATDGSPVPSGKVILREIIDGTRVTNPTSFRAPIKSGKFEIQGVPGGQYLVEGSSINKGFAPTFSPQFTVDEGVDRDNILVQATRGAEVIGKIVDADGNPVSNAEVSTEDKAGYLPGWPTNIIPQKVRTDSAGQFKLRALKPETYVINVVAAGFVKWSKQDVVITEGGDKDLGLISLSRGGTVTGLLTDNVGQPVVGGQVYLRLTDAGVKPRRYTAKSKNEGEFTMNNVQPGNYTLWSVPQGVDGPAPGGKRVAAKIVVSDSVVTTQHLTLDYSTVRTRNGEAPRPGMKWNQKEAMMETKRQIEQLSRKRRASGMGRDTGTNRGGAASKTKRKQGNKKPKGDG